MEDETTFNFSDVDLSNYDMGDGPRSLEDTVLDQKKNQVNYVMRDAVNQNPAEIARINNLSRATGIPYDAVATDPKSVENELLFRGTDTDDLVRNNPVLTKYLTDLRTGALFHQDIKQLSPLERILREEGVKEEGGIFTNLGQSLGLSVDGMVEGLKLRIADNTNKNLTLMTERLGLELSDEQSAFQQFFNIPSGVDQKAQNDQYIQDTIQALQDIEQKQSDLTPANLNILQKGVRAGLESLVMNLPSIVAAVATRGNVAASLAPMAVQSYTASYGDARANGLTEEEADRKASIDAAIEVGTEIMPLKTLEKIITGKSEGLTKGALEFMIKEMGTEQIATLGQTINDYAFGLDEQLENATSISEVLGIQAERQAVTAIATIVAGGAQNIGAVALNKLTTVNDEQQRLQIQSMAEQRNIDSINESANNNELRKLDKELFRQYVAESNSNDKQIFIDGVQAKLYLDTQKGVDDPALNLLRAKVAEASALGNDLSISVADFATDMAGTVHYDALRDSMTMSGETTAPFRQEQQQQETQNYLTNMIAEAQENVSDYVEAQEVFDNMVQELVDSGRTSSRDARVMSTVGRAYFNSRAEREGTSLKEEYQRSGLNITGPQTGEAQRLASEMALLNQQLPAYMTVTESRQTRNQLAEDLFDAGWQQDSLIGDDDLDLSKMSSESRQLINALEKDDYLGFDNFNDLLNVIFDEGLGALDASQQTKVALGRYVNSFGFGLETRIPDAQSELPTGVTQPDAQTFVDNITQAFANNPNSTSADVYSVEDYTGMDLYTVDNGRAGFAVRDGMLISVFKDPASDIRAMDTLMPLAIQAGVDKLEAFDGFLVEQYKRFGFEEVDRLEWDDQYAPEGWDYDRLGRPDLVIMELSNEASNEAVQESQRLRQSDAGIQQGAGARRGQLQALEGSPSVEGINGPIEGLVNVAEQYARDNGIDLKRQAEYVDVDPEFATRVAEAYEQMENAPNDPIVREAYDNLIQQTMAQYQALVDAGYQFWFVDLSNDDNLEYISSPWNSMRDIAQNKRMGVFPTNEGFGTDAQFDATKNPLLADTGLEWSVGGPDGPKAPVYANDLFRAVHDAFGHGLEGAGFRARGEENAWQAHVRLFTGSAIGAITSETRGQNSWVNYGPNGEANRTASAEDTVFADQKVGLMPEWTWTERRADDMGDETTEPMVFRQAQLNSIGLYSGVESAVETMNIQNWGNKSAKNKPEVKRLQAELDALSKDYNEKRDAQVKLRNEQREFELANPNLTDEQIDELDRAEEEVRMAKVNAESELRRTRTELNKALTPRASGKEIWAKLKKEAGVKAEELEWLGIEDYLLAANEKLSRDDVIDFVRRNGVKVEEITSEGGGPDRNDIEFDWDEGEPDMYSENWAYIAEDLAMMAMEDRDRIYQEAREYVIEQDRAYIDQNKDPEMSDEDYADEELQDAISDRVDYLAEQEAREQYEQNPVMVHELTDNAGNIIGEDMTITAVGNDEMGYHVRNDIGEIIVSEVYSLNEAAIQTEQYMRDYGYLDDITSDGAKWEEYVTEGDYENYREIKLTLPEITPEFYNTVHFEEPNIVAFLRVTDRELAVTDEIPVRAEPEPPTPVNYEIKVVDHTGVAGPKKVLIMDTDNDAEIFSGIPNMDKYDSEQQLIDEIQRNLTKSAIERDGREFPNYTFSADGVMSRNGRPAPPAPSRYADTYFVDEFQSDWHQDGRQKGYQQGIDTSEQRSIMDKTGVAVNNVLSKIKEELLPITQGDKAEDLREKSGSFITENKVTNTTTVLSLFQAQGELYLQGLEALKNSDYWSESLASNYEELISNFTRFKNAYKAIQAEKSGVPDAPFKGNAWLNLGLKRALVDAVDQGKDSFAWADANVLSDRWSETYRKLYEMQYDTKMVSAVKKLTKATPKHLNMDGEAHEHQELGYWVIELTPELKEQIKRDSFTMFQEGMEKQPEAGVTRGYYDPSQSMIRLTEASDLTTFMHEFAHFMYENELINKDKSVASAEMVANIHNWFKRNATAVAKEANGYEDIDVNDTDVALFLDNGTTGDTTKDKAIRRAVHEQFARGFETYMMEGKAPSIELRNVFRTISRWIVEAYKAIRGDLNVNLDDQMRQVFDRLLATEEQLASAEARAQYAPLFTDATMAGMTEKQFADYKKNQEKVKERSTETLREKLIKQLTRTTEKWWKEELKDEVDVQRAQLETERVYRARDALKNGDIKMDHAEVKEMVGEEVTNKLGRKSVRIPPKLNGTTAKGGKGLHPDMVAEELGYGSGDEMIQDLLDAVPIEEKAEAQAEAAMLDRHGDIMNDGTIEKEADEALVNEQRGALILQELRLLSKGTNRPKIDKATIKSMAEEEIAKLSFRNLHPEKYRKAEIRHAQQASLALKAGNKEEAIRAKTMQVLNYYLYKSAMDARNETTRIVDRMARFNKKTTREAIMKAGNGYMEQIDKILARFEFRKSASLKQVGKMNENIKAWAEARMSEDGDELILSDEVLNELYVTHWKNLPFTELKGVDDSLKNMEHVARYANKIKVLQEKVDFTKLVNQLVESIRTNVIDPDKFSGQRTTTIDVVKDKFSGMLAMMTKVPFLVRWMDGGEAGGLAHNVFMQPFTDAYARKAKMWQEHGQKIVDLINNRSKEDKKRHGEKLFIPEIQDNRNDGNLYGSQVLTVALNVGNESNMIKMLVGEGWASPDDPSQLTIDNPQLQAVLSHMTKSDWELVQAIWDAMEQLYPMLAEVHRESTGQEPPKIQAVPVQTSFGEFRGGYYPMSYDRYRDPEIDKKQSRSEAVSESDLFGRGSIQPSVSASAVNSRTKFKGPINMNLDVVLNHFDDTIHYITHHDAVRQTNKLLNNASVQSAIEGAFGPEEFKQMKQWLSDLAKDGRMEQPKNKFLGIFSRVRHGITLGTMGFSVSTMLMQPLGLFNTMAEVGVGNTIDAIKHLYFQGNTKERIRFAMEKSKILDTRRESMDREVKNAINRVNRNTNVLSEKLDKMQQASFYGMTNMQFFIADLTTWYGAYNKELQESGDEDKAIRVADATVEAIQGSGLTKEMSGIMRDRNELWQTMTMFMTFFNSLFNMSRDLGRGARQGYYSPSEVAFKGLLIFILPVIAEQLIRGQLIGEDEDGDEELKLKKLALMTASYPLAGVPVLRDFASPFMTDYGYNMSPVAGIIGRGLESSGQMLKRSVDEDKDITYSQVKNSVRLGAAVANIPATSQVFRTGEHLYEVMEEGEELTVRELLLGPDREED